MKTQAAAATVRVKTTLGRRSENVVLRNFDCVHTGDIPSFQAGGGYALTQSESKDN